MREKDARDDGSPPAAAPAGPPSRDRLRRFLASRRGGRAALALGLVIALPALSVGLLHDDLLHRLELEGAVPGVSADPLALYEFTRDDSTRDGMVQLGLLPWWTAPDLSVRFLRPLSSLSLFLDQALFGRAAFPAHVQSLLWLAILCAFVAALLRRVIRPTAATIATLIYAVAGAHGMTSSWLAARHCLIGAAFGVVALFLHVSWRQDGARWRGIAAPFALLCGMLASELALGAVVFVVLFELLAERGPGRVRAALPAVALALGYLVTYVSQGYGAHDSGTYILPTDDPAGFARAVVERVPVLAAELYGGLPSFLWAAEPLRPVLAASGLVFTTVVALLLYGARRRLTEPEGRRLAWLGASSVLCLVPVVGSAIGGRLLPIALVGSSALVASAMVESWSRGADAGAWRRRARRALVVVLAALHVGLAGVGRVVTAGHLGRLAEVETRLGPEADLEACPEGGLAYVLTGADPVVGLYAIGSLGLYAPEALDRLARFRVISMAPHDQALRTIDAGTLELSITEGPRVANFFERLYRAAPLREGAVVRTEELEVEVREVSPDGLFRTLRLRVDGMDRLCLLRWDGERLVAEPPPPIGEAREVPHAPGPMGL